MYPPPPTCIKLSSCGINSQSQSDCLNIHRKVVLLVPTVAVLTERGCDYYINIPGLLLDKWIITRYVMLAITSSAQLSQRILYSQALAGCLVKGESESGAREGVVECYGGMSPLSPPINTDVVWFW